MSSLNERNPYNSGGGMKIAGGAKKTIKNPFQTMNVPRDDDNEFSSVNFSSNTGNRSANTVQAPFGGREQQHSSHLQQPMGNNRTNNPWENQTNTSQKPGGFEVHDVSGISANNGPRGGFNQDPLYNNSFISNNSSGGNFFMPQPTSSSNNQPYDEENEPPLLEDLGVDVELIKVRTLAVLKFKELDERFAKDADMSGPFCIAMAMGALLMLSGKLHFGYIYGFGMIGTIALYMIMNLLSQQGQAKLYNTMSILGYCLIPVVALSFLNIFLNLVSLHGFILCGLAILWSTVAATRFFKVLLNLDAQKYLVGYPVFLFYLVFVLITIF